MPSSIVKTAFALVMVLGMGVMTGCVQDSIQVKGSLNARHVSTHLAEAAKKGYIRTEITGNPLGVSDALWIEHILSVFKSSHFGPTFDFLIDAPANPVTDARFVVQFQPPPSTTLKTICSVPDKLAASIPPENDQLTAFAALCVWGRPLDWAFVTGPMPASLDDERLPRFASTITLNVVRSNLRETDGCDSSNC